MTPAPAGHDGPTAVVVAEGRWPETGDTGPPPSLPGFTASDFPAAVARAAQRCLDRAPEAREPGLHTGILLASASGDPATSLALELAAEPGQRVSPLLFFQSNPNAVLGHIAARWGLTGPLSAMSLRLPDDDVRETAEQMLTDGDAELLLVVTAEAQPRLRAHARLLTLRQRLPAHPDTSAGGTPP